MPATPAVHDPPARLPLRERIWHRWLGRPYRLHVTDHGGDGPVIVLLHGLASSSANWKQLIPLLQQDYRCISVDLIGFGDSPKPQWYAYDMADHVRSIEAAIARLRLKRPFTIVGHSLGSLVATRYAADNPRRVERLVLLSPPVYAPLDDEWGSRAARQRTSMYLNAYRLLRGNKRFTADNLQRLVQTIPQLRSVAISHETWLPFVRSLERSIEQQTFVADIRRVRAPTDIFYGIFDEVVVPYNVKQLSAIDGVRLHPLLVNHFVGKRYSASVADVLRAERLEAAAG